LLSHSRKVFVSHRILVTIGEVRTSGTHTYVARLPDDVPRGDTSEEPGRSRLQLLEDGVPLGPAHALHSEIAGKGKGYYSHWGEELFFSTSDNSDPRTNGRAYHLLLPARDDVGPAAAVGPKSLRLITYFEALEGHAFFSRLPSGWAQGNTVEESGRSRLQVFEDGFPLGPAHALHSDIAGVGGGHYSHWGDKLVLSTSDNSDPRTNGREYHVLVTQQTRADSAATPQVPKALYPVSYFRELGGLGYSSQLPRQIPWGDTYEDSSRSLLQLLEDGIPLGPAHAPHSDITSQGRGRFSHWGDTLLLSTSDNSDPRVNGRAYHALFVGYLDLTTSASVAGTQQNRPWVARSSPEYNWARIGLDVSPVGTLGKNLSIVVRAREDATPAEQRSMSPAADFPDFEGEITFIPGDNERDWAKVAAQPFLPTQTPPQLAPTGPMQALNSAIFRCTRDWVLIVDDEVSFAPGLLSDLDRLTSASATSFYSIAMLDPEGAVLLRDKLLAYPERSAIHFQLLTTAEASGLEQPLTSCSAVNALWLGPILVKRCVFQIVGGFDTALSGGLERLELSIRLRQAGISVDSAAIGSIQSRSNSSPPFLRHNFTDMLGHPAFAKQAAHLEKKHHVITNAVLPSDFSTISRVYTGKFARRAINLTTHDQRQKIALVIDYDNWAFASIARQIIKSLSDEFDFVVIPSVYITNPSQILLMCDGCNLIHFFHRWTIGGLSGWPFQQYCRELGVDQSAFLERLMRGKVVTTGIYDHLFTGESYDDSLRFIINEICVDYYVSSSKLLAIYGSKPGLRLPMAVVSDGVDLEQFSPRRLDRYDDPRDRQLIIGWVGTSSWGSETEDVKGVHTILNPAIEAANARGSSFRRHFADRDFSYVPPSRMPQYYAEIDILVCSSKIEGTPNPVLEAMASGVPVISTNVGVVADAFGPLQRRFLLPSRDVECMVRALEELDANRHLLRELSQENLKYIRGWDWSLRVESFRTFFTDVLDLQRRHAAR